MVCAPHFLALWKKKPFPAQEHWYCTRTYGTGRMYMEVRQGVFSLVGWLCNGGRIFQMLLARYKYRTRAQEQPNSVVLGSWQKHFSGHVSVEVLEWVLFSGSFVRTFPTMCNSLVYDMIPWLFYYFFPVRRPKIKLTAHLFPAFAVCADTELTESKARPKKKSNTDTPSFLSLHSPFALVPF